MIFPKKHITVYESLMGLVGFVLLIVKEEKLTIDEVWKKYDKINDSKKFPAKHNFDDLVLSIDILFSLNKINVDDEGRILYEVN
jgi:hypothetical protein